MSKKNKKISIILIAVIAGILFWMFFSRASGRAEFIAAYQSYDSASHAHEAAAHVPGGGNNAARQKLDRMLSRVLTENLLRDERRQLSESALVSVAELRLQIDAVAMERKKSEAAMETLRAAGKKVGGFFASRKAVGIVAFADERSRILKDVEGISYGINTRLENIFRGIIADGGALSPERIAALNQDLPEAEKQFDRLTENYRKLDEIGKKIRAAFILFREDTSGLQMASLSYPHFFFTS